MISFSHYVTNSDTVGGGMLSYCYANVEEEECRLLFIVYVNCERPNKPSSKQNTLKLKLNKSVGIFILNFIVEFLRTLNGAEHGCSFARNFKLGILNTALSNFALFAPPVK